MIAPETDPVGICSVATLAALGYDYVELSLADMAVMPDDAFAALAQRLERSGLRCEACNNFFPHHVRLTGDAADVEAAVSYGRRALARAARVGARVVVFGSAAAKNVPAGFPRKAAWRQIAALLRVLGRVAAEHDVVIAVEPINRRESNIVNLAAEGLDLVGEVGHPNVQLLVDYYHLTLESEDPEVILRAGPAVRHVHFAAVDGRRFPQALDASASAFFRRLRLAGYTGRCSIEAFTDDFRADAELALRVLRRDAGGPAHPDAGESGRTNL